MKSIVFRSSYQKVERAEELLGEIQNLMAKDPPYKYALETNTQTNERATLAKVNEVALDKLVVRCGEVLHNLRSAIDHAYWDAVSLFVSDDKTRKSIQFPFARDANNLEQTLKSRQADKPGPRFYDAVKGFRSYAGAGGNTLLVLIHEINIVDKHKFPTPTGNFTKINSESIRKQVPDFPRGLVNCSAGMCKKDVVWKSQTYNREDIGAIVPPFTCLFHKDLDVPVETWISFTGPSYSEEIVTTLRKMIQETRRILDTMANALN